MRRTQKERKEATVQKLLDAGAEALVELGWAGATVQAIASRAGVSQGGLFRHFPSREAMLVHVADHLGRRILARYRDELRKLRRTTQDELPLALRLVRAACRSRDNFAWYELTVASRTNPKLKAALQPIARAYYASIEALGRELVPGIAEALGDGFAPLLDTIVAVFDGEAMRRFVLESPAAEAKRLALLEVIAAAAVRDASEARRPRARPRLLRSSR